MKERIQIPLAKLWSGLKKRWWWGILLVIGVGIYFVSAQEKPFEIEAFTVEEGEIKEFLLEEATTRLDEEYTLTMPVAGEIPRIKFKVGDTIASGETILNLRRFARHQELLALQAQIQEVNAHNQGANFQVPGREDYTTAQNQVDTAQNQYIQSQHQKSSREIELAQLEKNLQRHERLLLENAVSLNQVEELRKQVKLLQQAVQQDFISIQSAKKNVESALLALNKLKRTAKDQTYLHRVYGAQKKQLGSQIALKQDEIQRSRLTAPISGPILEVYAPDAGLLNAGAPLLKIGDPKSLLVETELLSEDIYKVLVGQTAEISGKALNNQIILGQVQRIYPQGFTKISALGVEQQRVKVIISLPPSKQSLKPGTRVDARIITAAKPLTIRIPERALFKQDKTWNVFKIVDQRLQLQAVTIGLKNEDWAEIVSGLQSGDQIVSRLENNLKPNQKVKELVKK